MVAMSSLLRRVCGVSLLVAAALVAVACGSPTSPSSVSGVAFSQTDLVTGTGTVAASGNRVTVAYTGWLYDSSKTDNKGTAFDSGTAFTFTVGAGQVIAGWDQGVPGMRVGGQRRLVIPANLAYGNRSVGPIPANSTLVFDITLTSVQ